MIRRLAKGLDLGADVLIQEPPRPRSRRATGRRWPPLDTGRIDRLLTPAAA
jgi:hypothetical protein